MHQTEFMWKMKTAGINLRQTSHGTVIGNLAKRVCIEQMSTHGKDMITLVFDMGSDEEIDIPLDRDPDAIEKIIQLYKNKATVKDYMEAFKDHSRIPTTFHD